MAEAAVAAPAAGTAPGERLLLLDGNAAAAWGARLSRIEVLPAYPITPEYPLMEHLVRFIERGELDCRFIRVESDHSAMAAAVGAALVGARAFTGTASQGLAYMSEVVFQASGLRLPIVMAVVNRALHAPHSRFPDQGDAIAQEGSGWVQLFCENAQEVLDTVIQAFRIAEDPRVRLPVMVNFEGYTLSHTKEPVRVPDAEAVARFAPPRRQPALDLANPQAINAASPPDLYWGYKYNQHRALVDAAAVIDETSAAFGEAFGRDWGGCMEAYRCEEAEGLIVAMGSLASAARVAVDALRSAGRRAGLLKIRSFRPFPAEAVRRAVASSGARTLVCVDRNCVFGAGGAVAREVKQALWDGDLAGARVAGWIAGLGGQEIGWEEIADMVRRSWEGDARGASGPLWYGADGPGGVPAGVREVAR